MRPARDLAGFWPLAGLERAAPPRQNPAHHDRFFNPFDENGIARVEIEPYNDVYSEVLLHRERGIIWPPSWDEPGVGSPNVVCWPESEKGEGSPQ